MSIHLFKLNLFIILFIQGTIEDELAELKQQVKQIQQKVILLTNELNEIKDLNEFNSVCPNDWISYLNTKCFKFIKEIQTEIESKERCKQLDEKSTLVTILSNEEQIFLSNNLENFSVYSDKIWIGLELKNSSYQWLDGSQYNYTNWDENAKQKEDCVLMSLLKSSLGKWSDESCNKRYSSLCQRKLSKQSKIIEKILNLTVNQDEFENQQDVITSRLDLQEYQIESQNNEILEINNTLEDYYYQILLSKNALDNITKVYENRFKNLTKVIENQEFNINTLKNALDEQQNQINSQNKQLNNLTKVIENQQNEFESQQNEITNRLDLQEYQIESQNNEILGINNTLEEYYYQMNSLIPIGFLYTQLPNQPSPLELWPSMKWSEVTSQYSGLFFRAEGGESLPFGQTQSANQSTISDVYFRGCRFDWSGGPPCSDQSTSLNREGWNDVTSSFPNSQAVLDLKFYKTGGEVRPKNTAIKIFKRIQ